MQACGMICEFNPFHNGHAYLIDTVKKSLGLPILCVMSGNFTQRGEPAMWEKSLRAQWAISCGADLVLELPFPFCSASAEGFAHAGIHLLQRLGVCTHFAFGSECADLERLQRAAAALDGDAMRLAHKLQTDCPALSLARARTLAVQALAGQDAAVPLTSPNDILAVEYLRANQMRAKQSGTPPLIPLAVQRKGAQHGSSVPSGSVASASYLRRSFTRSRTAGEWEGSPFLPDAVNLNGERAEQARLDPASPCYETALLANLCLMHPEELSRFAGITGGFEFVLHRGALASHSLNELFAQCRSKSVTDAKIRRSILYCYFRVTQEQLSVLPQYTVPLAFSETGALLLREIHAAAQIPVVSRGADAKHDPTTHRQYTFSQSSDHVLRTLCKVQKI